MEKREQGGYPQKDSWLPIVLLNILKRLLKLPPHKYLLIKTTISYQLIPAKHKGVHIEDWGNRNNFRDPVFLTQAT